ncbi:hypothetical protein J7J69_05475 [candidate division WOR-3 bacterium]|nr:hypothetical protein [candidate division WOR-3 bacterium]
MQVRHPVSIQSGLREKERHRRKYNRFLAHVIHQIAYDNVRKNAMYYVVRLLYYRLLAYKNLIFFNAA